MKRHGNLFERICSTLNLQLADAIARTGKSGQYGVISHDRNQVENIARLHEMLVNQTYTTSPYKIFQISDPKVRDIYALPYFPDRIVHHAVMNILEPILVSCFTADTYSCIKGRGIHAAQKAVERALRDHAGTQYCLQLDIKKFYPSVDHAVLKTLIRRKIKDPQLLWLFDDIIDSAQGLPIGNYLSQFLANFYLTPLDHWIKEAAGVRHYFRYSDDMVILAGSKDQLHYLRLRISEYLARELNLQVKSNHQVFPVDAQGIDFIGYRFYHGYTLLRKGIKVRFARAVASGKGQQIIASYLGWAKHANCNHLIKKLLPRRAAA